MSHLHVACVQISSGADIEENVAQASNLIGQAASVGAELVITPEMTSFMDVRSGALEAKSQPEHEHQALDAFRALASKLSIWLLVGSMSIRLNNGKFANRSFLIAPGGGIAARYDKIHMFDVDIDDGQVYRESDFYQPGGTAVVADLPGARIGLAICYDLRFARLFRSLAMAGAQLLCVPAAFTELTGEAHWHSLLRARAIENGAFVAAAGQCGVHPDGRKTYGHSLIVDPWGTIVADAGQQLGVIHANLDLDKCAQVRRRIPVLQNGRDFAEPV